MTTADLYQEHNVRDYIGSTGVTGVYYNQSVYLFYCQQETVPSFFTIQYDRVFIDYGKLSKDQQPSDAQLVPAETLKIYGSAPTQSGESGRVIANHQCCRSLATCVHQGVLYLFWNVWTLDTSPTKDSVYYSYCQLNHPQENSQWSTPQLIPNFEVSPGEGVQIAAVSNGQRLFIFGNLDNGKTHALNVAYSNDGQDWSTELREDWINVKNISACSYLTPQGETNIFFGMATQYNNIWTARYSYDPQQGGSGLVQVGMETHKEFDGKADFIALTAGSTEGGINGNVVQMFINGKHGTYWISGWENNKKKEFEVNTNTWFPAQERTHGYSRYPAWTHIGAFQYFRTIEDTGEVRQEVWTVMNYYNTSCSLIVARWKSDWLKLDLHRDKSGTYIDYEEETVPDALRTLVGVVEGPPPYVLNGGSLSPNSPNVSTVSYEFTREKETAFTSTVKFNAYVGIGAIVEVQSLGFGLQVQIAAEQAYQRKEFKVVATKDSAGYSPDERLRSEAIYIWLKPKIRRKSYTLSDWQGNPTNGSGEPLKTYLFSLSDIAVSSDRVNNLSTFAGSPNTHDIQTWKRRFTELPSFADRTRQYVNTIVDWDNNVREFGITEGETELDTNSTTVSASIEGKAGIFFGGSGIAYSYDIEYKTTISRAMKVALTYPTARREHPEDMVEVDLRVLMFYPNENQIDQCYWIPKGYSGKRPWCLAWSVDKMVTAAEKDHARLQSEMAAASLGEREDTVEQDTSITASNRS